eukprot:CAMPEP_0198301488 /NCGR_PEP_ID=MMETSP1449-20131203/51821_1 /TAXON_ID=420275 /ORGANISM="Attheya septentrionalis, Strain CCMP2084" /LENGTH=95 /DNA_ID=CAMNT_0044003585 /DNA_START=32 /DNA_END=319 /DNA_ORIENTATION=+
MTIHMAVSALGRVAVRAGSRGNSSSLLRMGGTASRTVDGGRSLLTREMQKRASLATCRNLLAVEASSMRIADLLDPESSIPRGWDAGIEDDDDGG